MRTVRLGTFDPTSTMINAVHDVLMRGRLSYGTVSKELENKFAKHHGCTHGVLSNSGTSSLVVALQALKEINGWHDGAEIICPATTFVATINAVLQCRLTPVLVDVHPIYYDIDPYLINDAITRNTVSVIAVNVFGKPADLPAISHICKSNKLKLIEDSCEALGVGIAGKPVGSWGDVGVFSFYMAHIIAAGVGGIATTSDPELALYMRSLVNHGISTKNLPSAEKYDPSFLAREFEFDKRGHSFRITEVEAAIALDGLDRLHNNISYRQKAAEYYDEILDPLCEYMQLPKVRPNSQSSWMMYPIVNRKQYKQPIMERLRDANIEVRDMLPLTTQPCYKGLFDYRDFPMANRINEHGFYIGCHQGLTMGVINRVEESMSYYWRYLA